MPSAANVKIEKPSLQSPTETTDVSGPAGALKQAIVIIEHKIRNLEKRKSKLESYRDLQNSGKELNSDQKTALAKINEVLTTLDFAKDLHKQFLGIVLATEKEAKKQAKRDAALKNQAELARLREILLVQDALNQMGTENVRDDFLHGRNGAAQLSEADLKLLDDLYPAVTPKHEAGSPTAFTNEVQAAAEHLLAVVDGKPKEVFGGSYSQIKEVLGKIHESGYFDQAETVEGQLEGEAAIETVIAEEPIADNLEANQDMASPSDAVESITIEASNNLAVHAAPQPLMVESVLAPQVEVQPSYAPQASQVPPVAQDMTFYQQQQQQQPPQQIPPMAAQQPPVQPMRPLTEMLGTGSFFFLQESEIDTPEQIPSQTFTNQTFVGQPPPPIPMPPNFQQHQPPQTVPQVGMPPTGPVVNHQINKQPILEEPPMPLQQPVDDLQKRGLSNQQNQQPYYNNGYNGRSNHRAPPQQSRNNGVSGRPHHQPHQPRPQATRH